MGDSTRANCRRCGRNKAEVGEISWAGYCAVCGNEVQTAHNTELHFHAGPWFVNWRRAMAASVGAVLVDDLRASE